MHVAKTCHGLMPRAVYPGKSYAYNKDRSPLVLSGLNQTVDQERLAVRVCFLPPYMVGTKIARSRGHIKAGNSKMNHSDVLFDRHKDYI